MCLCRREDALLEAAVRTPQGLTKQDYIMRKLTDREVVVMGIRECIKP